MQEEFPKTVAIRPWPEAKDELVAVGRTGPLRDMPEGDYLVKHKDENGKLSDNEPIRLLQFIRHDPYWNLTV